MEKGKKKKRKLKPKKGFIIPIIILVVVLAISGLIGYKIQEDNALSTIKKNYNKFVVTTKDTSLYNSKKKQIGTIKKGEYLELEELKTQTTKNKYLKIKDTDFYVKYNVIKKTKEKEIKVEDTNYLPLDLTIKLTSEKDLYDKDKKIITLKNTNLNVEYMDNNYYYVKLFNKTLKLKKDKGIKEEKLNKSKDENQAKYVSVIYYEKIDDNCGEDICLKKASVIAHMTKISQAGYHFITKNDYLDYLNGYKNLKEKAVLLSTNEVNDNVKNIEETYKIEIAKFDEKDGITFETTNKKSTTDDDKKKVNRYQAKRYTLIDDYVRMASGEDVADTGWQTSANQAVPVVNYHFFTNKEKGVECIPYETICLEENLFRSHLDYLKENNYKTLTIHEFSDWMDGIIEIPEKSILITVDDGAKGTGAHNGNILIPVLEEYKMHATLFLIAGWWDIANYQSPYLDIQSHTFDMHGGASGRKILKLNKDEIKEDIKKSLDVIQDNTTFCYPFYEYDNKSIQSLQELGVKYAFAGGSRHAKRSDNHYIVPRYPIVGDVTKDQFANMIN